MSKGMHVRGVTELMVLSFLERYSPIHLLQMQQSLQVDFVKDMAVGALHTTLTRLVKKGLLKKHDEVRDVSGQMVKPFSITEEGRESVRETREALLLFWD
jgi:DNA-binding PadR family transcriptional regulator